MVGFTKYIDIIYDDGSTKEWGGNGAILKAGIPVQRQLYKPRLQYQNQKEKIQN